MADRKTIKTTVLGVRRAFNAIKVVGGTDEKGRMLYKMDPPAQLRVLALQRVLEQVVVQTDKMFSAMNAEHRNPNATTTDPEMIAVKDAAAYTDAVEALNGTDVEVEIPGPLTAGLLGDAVNQIPPTLRLNLGPFYADEIASFDARFRIGPEASSNGRGVVEAMAETGEAEDGAP